MSYPHKNNVEVLGAMLASVDDTTVQYVVQVSLVEPAPPPDREGSFGRTFCAFELAMLLTANLAGAKSRVAEFVESLFHTMEIQRQSKSRVFTLRRDLHSICTLHAEIQAVIGVSIALHSMAVGTHINVC